MGLSPGQRLGAYEVVSALGAGGMGEVYRARDTRLLRDVAIKILPDSFAGDRDRLARFEREAQVVAALNHPNIAAIYGLEQSGEAHVLVLELVEGETLAELIARGPLAIPDALAIATQIADALQAAHDKGIIHRDLKPANIALGPGGQVKVLDFGLAKALGPPEGGPHVTEGVGAGFSRPTLSPTLSLAMTQAGMILGTAAYMSPEQAKGRPADKRADVWAFGCVLYEMLTGRRAFDSDDASETLAFVITKEPDWTLLPVDTPEPLTRLLRRCLQKDARERLHDIADARLEIKEALNAPPAHFATVGRRSRLRTFVPWAVAATATAVAVAGGVMWLVTRPGPPRITRTEITTSGEAQLILQGVDRDLAITPDGSRVVYRGNGAILVRSLDRIAPTALSGLGAPRGLFVSSDSQWVGFFDGNDSLKKVAITGGPPVTVTPVDGTGPRGASWHENTIVFATNRPSTGLQQVSAAGGEVTVLTKPDREHGEGDHFWPHVLPGGRAVLFTITPISGSPDPNNSQLAVLDLQTGTRTVLLRGGSHAQYVKTGHLVYTVAGTLRAVAFDASRLEIIGTPVPVLEGVTMTSGGAVDADLADDGTLVYLPGRPGAGAQRALVWVDRQGREDPIAAPLRAFLYPRLSPDGTRITVYSNDEEQDLWLWDLLRRTFTRMTFEPLQDYTPVWTRDSRRVFFGSERNGGQVNLWMQAADGTGTATQLTTSSRQQIPTSVTADGTRLLFHEVTAGQQRNLRLFTFAGAAASPAPEPAPAGAGQADDRAHGGTIRTLLDTRFEERGAVLSPDERWMAYESNSSGRFEIYVRPFPDVGAGVWQVSTSGGVQALWDRDGRELFFVAPDGAVMSVPSLPTGNVWSGGNPTKVLGSGYFNGTSTANVSRQYDVTPDGKRFLVIKEGSRGQSQTTQTLIVVQNWTEELKRMVPAN